MIMGAKPGDKVRLKSVGHRAARGVIEGVLDRGTLLVRLDGASQAIEVAPEHVTNFSLAARKAWVSMPHRQVGRPKGLRLCDRVSVTLRVDRELWERFQADESSGLIEDRTETINRWLRQKLDALERQESQGQCPRK
jgi:uncharacterized protein (DUF4415 family)